jgi:hypothetical protein
MLRRLSGAGDIAQSARARRCRICTVERAHPTHICTDTRSQMSKKFGLFNHPENQEDRTRWRTSRLNEAAHK